MRNFINMVENADDYFDGRFDYLFHSSPRENLGNILEHGISAISYWGSEEMARLFGERDGGDYVLFRVPMTRFNDAKFFIDENIVDYPVITDEDEYEERYQDWRDSNRSWRDCLYYWESVTYAVDLPVTENDIVR